ncbi:SIR2 family protein [Pseudomonas sp. NFACC07-1]|uniref:SIR2 family NAD-dependent protein deacylase n=1 Tax=Pseudomonas sp. NFACC07-1 TaxID=1566239 RepID=UPI0008D11D7A|nr:SIR2 family protein [Pseudomonas sp. NFACC07-1]SEJ91422.1 SIR2-like domain-containing protein [Pseudomonas sp. NFACC07-1]
MANGPNHQVHYNAVRRALQNGNAAVMVGAGFSKNAENGDELAMWQEVAQELWRELNPDAPELSDFSASTVTQLGEQYARVFSKPGLEELLKRLIPDDRVAPGLLHRSLLSLQWSEIFTTNYDTLLERAAEAIVDKAHYTVMCREDIPQSKILGRRRIVKLHGSFPSQRPFIFTEEDYRRYPEKSAPFINLVRQSMLENVFCLIGFSGDDPNFLYWIGWVRDMLDEHALPIYLFVIHPPSLGTQKLLESRRVTFVVLPTKAGVEDWDYAARFATLFEILKKPLTEDVEDWGHRPADLSPVLHSPENTTPRYDRVVAAFSSIRKARNSHPGWFVTPYAIRKRFSSSVRDIHSQLHSSQVHEQFLTQAPYVGIAVLAEYSWHQDVLLQCLSDELAEVALRLLEQTAPKSYNVSAFEKEDLESLEAQTPYAFQQRWKDLALGVLRWAREAVRQADFLTISDSLQRHFSTDMQVVDQLTYEDILLKLYTGERDIAQQSLKNWDIRSPDSYMLVRKGMLLGEVGEITAGLKIALLGLKRLRKNQRSRSKSTLYLSQEAWACLAIGYLQKTLDDPLDQQAPVDEQEFFPEVVTRRLSYLASIGHDVEREVLQITADLNAEAPAPSQPVTYTPLFELGRYSTTRHLAGGHSYGNKIHAAFAWLSLTDRVTLVPRVGNATFDIGSFGQAAWWVQHADSMQRVLSVMIRLLSSKMLEPRNPTQFIHSAGWLSRYQVAKTPELLAQELFERSMDFVDRMFPQEIQSDLMERVIGFHMQVSSRLIIRISVPGFAAAQLERVIRLYKAKQMVLHPDLWKQATNLTARCFEALSPHERLNSLVSLASIPDCLELGIRNRFHENDWLSLHLLHRRESDLVIDKPSTEMEILVDALIDRLLVNVSVIGTNSAESEPTAAGIWSRLFWIREWGGVSKSQISTVEGLLLSEKDWPAIPGRHRWAVFSWVTSARKKSAKKRYKHWILQQSLEDFSSVSLRPAPESRSVRSWGLRNADDFLTNFCQSIDLASWSEDEMATALLIIKRWWDAEWLFIQPELSRLDELKKMFVTRMKAIDSIIAAFIDAYSLSALTKRPGLMDWLDEMREGLKAAGSSLLCTDLACAFNSDDRAALAQLESKVLLRLFDSDIVGANDIAKVISYWAQHRSTKQYEPPSGLVYSLAGVISARRMPVLPWALSAVTEISERHPDWITSSCYSLLNVGLTIMLSELTYVERPDGTGIPDDSVPVLRFGCVRLARALRVCSFYRAEDACGLWLKQAITDPLPELRFI